MRRAESSAAIVGAVATGAGNQTRPRLLRPNDLASRCAIPPAAARTAKATLGSFAGYGARGAMHRLPPCCAGSRVNGGKGTAAAG